MLLRLKKPSQVYGWVIVLRVVSKSFQTMNGQSEADQHVVDKIMSLSEMQLINLCNANNEMATIHKNKPLLLPVPVQ